MDGALNGVQATTISAVKSLLSAPSYLQSFFTSESVRNIFSLGSTTMKDADTPSTPPKGTRASPRSPPVRRMSARHQPIQSPKSSRLRTSSSTATPTNKTKMSPRTSPKTASKSSTTPAATETGSETNERKLTRKVTRSAQQSMPQRLREHLESTMAGPSTSTAVVVSNNNNNSTSKQRSTSKPGTRKGGQNGQPVELFRTDFITAMKVNDADASVDVDRLMAITDSWRQDWNKGVQVPVNPEKASSRKAEVRILDKFETVKVKPANSPQPSTSFELPAKRYLRLTKDAFYRADWHKIVPTSTRANAVCPYDMDDLDTEWLRACNKKRKQLGIPEIDENDFERIMECLETITAEVIDTAVLNPNNNQFGREYDDDAVCDVCMSPYQDDDDCIVFCDGCDLCVHQSCYGIAELPQGPWLCRVCALIGGRLPACQLCPNRGGAMKCTQSGERWAHISCVLWIPEVRFGDPELLEPVMHLANVPEDRWLLRCSLCDKREGACIQCDVRSCRQSYHVTCAQRKGLEMRSVTASNGELKLLSYCAKHSRQSTGGLFDPPQSGAQTPSASRASSLAPSRAKSRATSPAPGASQTAAATQALLDSPRKRKARRMQTMYGRFYQFAQVDKCALKLKLHESFISPVFEYWKLKRRRNHNHPLLTSREDEAEMLERQEEEALVRRVRTLIAMRQNLEKARNLCYMLCRREKVKRQYVDCLQSLGGELHGIMDNSKAQLSRREAASLTSNYLRPLAGFDEVMFDRVTDETIEADVSEWIRASGISSPEPQGRPSSSRRQRRFSSSSDPFSSEAGDSNDQLSAIPPPTAAPTAPSINYGVTTAAQQLWYEHAANQAPSGGQRKHAVRSLLNDGGAPVLISEATLKRDTNFNTISYLNANAFMHTNHLTDNDSDSDTKEIVVDDTDTDMGIGVFTGPQPPTAMLSPSFATSAQQRRNLAFAQAARVAQKHAAATRGVRAIWHASPPRTATSIKLPVLSSTTYARTTALLHPSSRRHRQPLVAPSIGSRSSLGSTPPKHNNNNKRRLSNGVIRSSASPRILPPPTYSLSPTTTTRSPPLKRARIQTPATLTNSTTHTTTQRSPIVLIDHHATTTTSERRNTRRSQYTPPNDTDDAPPSPYEFTDED